MSAGRQRLPRERMRWTLCLRQSRVCPTLRARSRPWACESGGALIVVPDLTTSAHGDVIVALAAGTAYRRSIRSRHGQIGSGVAE
jgi:hypothetical protein